MRSNTLREEDHGGPQFCKDAAILFTCRCLRMFSYGAIAVVFYIYLLNQYTVQQTTLLISLTMVGDLFMTLRISTRADRYWGRRNALRFGSLLKFLAGAGFAFFSHSFPAALVCGIVGVITPTGGEIGPFINVEQAALADLNKKGDLHSLSYIMAWYQAAGGVFAALGAFAAGKGISLITTWYHVHEPLRYPISGGNLSTGLGPVVDMIVHNSSTSIQRMDRFVATFSPASAVAGHYADPTSTSAQLVLLSYRWVFFAYGCIALLMFSLYSRLSDKVEPTEEELERASLQNIREDEQEEAEELLNGEDSSVAGILWGGVTWFFSRIFGLSTRAHHQTIFRMSSLFALDAFAGALILQSYIAFWFHDRWGVDENTLGMLLLGVNAIGGLSGFVSSYLVRSIGAIRTMVFTHLPSNVLVALVPLMPSEQSAMYMLFARFSISQMDVPARQAYVNTVVPSTERSAANGVTNSARTVGVAFAPYFLKFFLASPRGLDAPFYIAGILKIAYDLVLYRLFKHTEEEKEEEEDHKEPPHREGLAVQGAGKKEYGTV